MGLTVTVGRLSNPFVICSRADCVAAWRQGTHGASSRATGRRTRGAPASPSSNPGSGGGHRRERSRPPRAGHRRERSRPPRAAHHYRRCQRGAEEEGAEGAAEAGVRGRGGARRGAAPAAEGEEEAKAEELLVECAICLRGVRRVGGGRA